MQFELRSKQQALSALRQQKSTGDEEKKQSFAELMQKFLFTAKKSNAATLRRDLPRERAVVINRDDTTVTSLNKHSMTSLQFPIRAVLPVRYVVLLLLPHLLLVWL